MGMLDPNTLIGILNGKLGNLVFARYPNGKIVVRRRPTVVSAASQAQSSNQALFRQALAYVSRIRSDPAAYAAYQVAAKISRKRACDLANADFRNLREIREILCARTGDNSSQLVAVKAFDDFQVCGVSICLTLPDGTVLEQGEAALNGSTGESEYVTQSVVAPARIFLIHATAADLAGNTCAATIVHSLTEPFGSTTLL